MSGFVSDGPVVEAPLGAADQEYAATPPSLATGVAALFHAGSAIEPIARWLQHGVAGAEGVSGWLARGMTLAAGAEGGMTPEEMGLTPEGQAKPSPLLSADEVNDRYGPIGPDGKKVKITDRPMPEALARLVGQEKAAAIERDGIIARFEHAHGWAVNFATGTAAFLMDPLNAATALVPGVGEEAVAARVGGGWLGRLAGRAVAGATGAAAGQAPLTALRYLTAGEEGEDYGLRDAFRDLAYGAAGGALLHGAGGALGDALRGRGMAGERAAAEILSAAAPTKADAMRSAVAQIADGRPVDVAPIFEAAQAERLRALPVIDEGSLRLLSEEAGLRQRGEGLADLIKGIDVAPDARAAQETLARLDEVERGLSSATTADERRPLLDRRDELLTNTNPETLREKAASLEIRRQAESELARVSDRLREIMALATARSAETALSPLPKLAQQQARLYRDGFAPGLTQGDFDAAYRPVYGPQEAADASKPAELVTKAPSGSKGDSAGQRGRLTQGETAERQDGAPAATAAPADRELAEAEAALPEAARAALAPEERAELDASERAMADAQQHGAAYEEAANCLRAAE